MESEASLTQWISNRGILVIYGTQTGTARDVAEEIQRMLRRLGAKSRVCSMSDFDITLLPQQRFVIFTCSTTGQGEVPDSMKGFWRSLLNRRLPPTLLAGVRYAVFGLGDSSYVKFNYAGKMLHNRMGQLGAAPLVRRGDGDDQHQHGFYGDLFPWLMQLAVSVAAFIPSAQIDQIGAIPQRRPESRCLVTFSSSTEGVRSNNPLFPSAFHARLLINSRITAPSWDQDVRHVALDITDSGLSYIPGDVVYIQPKNSPEDVSRFAALFGVAGDSIITSIAPRPNMTEYSNTGEESLEELIPASAFSCCKSLPLTVNQVLESYLDIAGTPKRYFFELLSFFATDSLQQERLRYFASKEGAEEMYDYSVRSRRSYMDVLTDFDSARPSIDYIFELVPALQPRPFSISSAQELNPTKIEVSMAVIRYKSIINRFKRGVCSNWIGGLDPHLAPTIPIWVKRGTLSLPQNPLTPLIMVGPGTGCAIFRAFLQQRLALKRQGIQVGPSAFFFGCRHQEADFIYSDEWHMLLEEGVLTHFGVAFSRDPPKRVYVQDIMLHHASALWKMIQDGGHFYISGRAAKMPSEVRGALRKIIQQEAALSEDAAEEFLKNMERSNRYSTETWS